MKKNKEDKMYTLKNKIDFAVIMVVKNANPNGDPLYGNRPRITFDNLGEMSDVCLKRKIRNYLMEIGESIFVQSDDNKKDDCASLRARQAEFETQFKITDKKVSKKKEFIAAVCKKWYDVRAFGQVFAYSKDKDNEETQGVSIGIRGPVTIQSAFTVAPISSSSIQITKSVSGEGEGTKKTSDTMGMKHRVDHGLYITYGSIHPQLASLTVFSEEDALKLREALQHLFLYDASSARPSGTMEVYKVYWWEHDNPTGQDSSAIVHRSLRVSVKNGVATPSSIDDYDISVEKLENLSCQEYDGR